MEKIQHPNRCATAVFGRKYMGAGDIPAMGLFECAAWIEPTIYTGHRAKSNPQQIHVGRSSAMDLSVMASFDRSNYGQEGYPTDQEEADLIAYQRIGETCFKLGLCDGCDRFVEGQPVILLTKPTK